MKTLSCADMGIANCNYVARADSEKDVIDKAMEHGQTIHPDKLNGMDADKMVHMMKAKVKNVTM